MIRGAPTKRRDDSVKKKKKKATLAVILSGLPLPGERETKK